MFKLIKWLLMIMVIGSIWYLVNFYLTMDKNDKTRLKKDISELLNSGQIESIKKFLSDKLSEDIQEKKNKVLEYFR